MNQFFLIKIEAAPLSIRMKAQKFSLRSFRGVSLCKSYDMNVFSQGEGKMEGL